MATCLSCHQQIPEITELKFCPFCGAWISPETKPAPSPSPEMPAPMMGEPESRSEPSPPIPPLGEASKQQYYVHWEDRYRLGFLAAFSQTWSDSTFRPADFFRRLPKIGNLGSALLYAFLIGTAAGLLSLFWEYLFWDSLTNLKTFEDFMGQELSRELLGFVALVIPLATIIGIFIASFIYHLCLLITGSNKYGWEATMRGLCYSYGPQFFTLVPLCGGLISFIWQYILMVIAWREVHESTTGRVLLASLLPFILCCGAVLMLIWGIAGMISQFVPSA
jgi:hypothetical protein